MCSCSVLSFFTIILNNATRLFDNLSASSISVRSSAVPDGVRCVRRSTNVLYVNRLK